MGWVLVRPDGTIRAWNANTQDDHPAPGETWHGCDEYPGNIRRLKWDGTALVSLPPPPPRPDVEAFEAALITSFGGMAGVLGLMKKYPAWALFWRALEDGDFAGARVVLDDALASGVLTQDQHQRVVALAAAAAVPL